MIRFCDKMVYCINEGDMTRGEMFSFFLGDKERQTDVIIVYDRENGELVGIVTYDTLLFGVEGNRETYINTACICVEGKQDEFWEEANEYFSKCPKELLTVVDAAGNVLGFAYFEEEEHFPIIRVIQNALEYGIPIRELPEYQRIQMLVITDLNEPAWKIRRIFAQEGFKVCVIGEKWEWFGYKSGEGYLDCADFEKLYLYSEGKEFRRIEKRNVRSRFNPINDNLSCLMEMFRACCMHRYINAVKKYIQKGIRVYECSLPLVKDISYFTKEELEYVLNGNSLMYDFWVEGKGDRYISDKEKNYIKTIFGEEVFQALVSGKIERLDFSLENRYKIADFTGYTTQLVNKRRIYLLGPCIVAGRACVYEDTLLYSLQKQVEKTEYTVVAISVSEMDYMNWNKVCENISLNEGDIIVVINKRDFFMDEEYGQNRVDLSYVYNRERNTMFSDMPIHANAEGCHILAQEIYENYLKSAIEAESKKGRRLLQKGEILSTNEIEQVKIYTDGIKKETEGTVGSIVMNCNPFTYGHQYLIEYAALQVDWLYIFVVEENRSSFTFEERYEMVKEGISHLENVIVVPSGKFVLSYETMPIYFVKAEKQEAEVDARLDLEIFARHIAPALNISKRFVGEEPMDKVTKQYNEQMKDIFELFELELEVIPRKEKDGEVISASRVRKYMEESKWEQVKELVPMITFERCRKYRKEESYYELCNHSFRRHWN